MKLRFWHTPDGRTRDSAPWVLRHLAPGDRLRTDEVADGPHPHQHAHTFEEWGPE